MSSSNRRFSEIYGAPPTTSSSSSDKRKHRNSSATAVRGQERIGSVVSFDELPAIERSSRKLSSAAHHQQPQRRRSTIIAQEREEVESRQATEIWQLGTQLSKSEVAGKDRILVEFTLYLVTEDEARIGRGRQHRKPSSGTAKGPSSLSGSVEFGSGSTAAYFPESTSVDHSALSIYYFLAGVSEEDALTICDPEFGEDLGVTATSLSPQGSQVVNKLRQFVGDEHQSRQQLRRAAPGNNGSGLMTTGNPAALVEYCTRFTVKASSDNFAGKCLLNKVSYATHWEEVTEGGYGRFYRKPIASGCATINCIHVSAFPFFLGASCVMSSAISKDSAIDASVVTGSRRKHSIFDINKKVASAKDTVVTHFLNFEDFLGNLEEQLAREPELEQWMSKKSKLPPPPLPTRKQMQVNQFVWQPDDVEDEEDARNEEVTHEEVEPVATQQHLLDAEDHNTDAISLDDLSNLHSRDTSLLNTSGETGATVEGEKRMDFDVDSNRGTEGGSNPTSPIKKQPATPPGNRAKTVSGNERASRQDQDEDEDANDKNMMESLFVKIEVEGTQGEIVRESIIRPNYHREDQRMGKSLAGKQSNTSKQHKQQPPPLQQQFTPSATGPATSLPPARLLSGNSFENVIYSKDHVMQLAQHYHKYLMGVVDQKICPLRASKLTIPLKIPEGMNSPQCANFIMFLSDCHRVNEMHRDKFVMEHEGAGSGAGVGGGKTSKKAEPVSKMRVQAGVASNSKPFSSLEPNQVIDALVKMCGDRDLKKNNNTGDNHHHHNKSIGGKSSSGLKRIASKESWLVEWLDFLLLAVVEKRQWPTLMKLLERYYSYVPPTGAPAPPAQHTATLTPSATNNNLNAGPSTPFMMSHSSISRTPMDGPMLGGNASFAAAGGAGGGGGSTAVLSEGRVVRYTSFHDVLEHIKWVAQHFKPQEESVSAFHARLDAMYFPPHSHGTASTGNATPAMDMSLSSAAEGGETGGLGGFAGGGHGLNSNPHSGVSSGDLLSWRKLCSANSNKVRQLMSHPSDIKVTPARILWCLFPEKIQRYAVEFINGHLPMMVTRKRANRNVRSLAQAVVMEEQSQDILCARYFRLFYKYTKERKEFQRRRQFICNSFERRFNGNVQQRYFTKWLRFLAQCRIAYEQMNAFEKMRTQGSCTLMKKAYDKWRRFPGERKAEMLFKGSSSYLRKTFFTKWSLYVPFSKSRRASELLFNNTRVSTMKTAWRRWSMYVRFMVSKRKNEAAFELMKQNEMFHTRALFGAWMKLVLPRIKKRRRAATYDFAIRAATSSYQKMVYAQLFQVWKKFLLRRRKHRMVGRELQLIHKQNRQDILQHRMTAWKRWVPLADEFRRIRSAKEKQSNQLMIANKKVLLKRYFSEKWNRFYNSRFVERHRSKLVWNMAVKSDCSLQRSVFTKWRITARKRAVHDEQQEALRIFFYQNQQALLHRVYHRWLNKCPTVISRAQKMSRAHAVCQHLLMQTYPHRLKSYFATWKNFIPVHKRLVLCHAISKTLQIANTRAHQRRIFMRWQRHTTVAFDAKKRERMKEKLTQQRGQIETAEARERSVFASTESIFFDLYFKQPKTEVLIPEFNARQSIQDLSATEYNQVIQDGFWELLRLHQKESEEKMHVEFQAAANKAAQMDARSQVEIEEIQTRQSIATDRVNEVFSREQQSALVLREELAREDAQAAEKARLQREQEVAELAEEESTARQSISSRELLAACDALQVEGAAQRALYTTLETFTSETSACHELHRLQISELQAREGSLGPTENHERQVLALESQQEFVFHSAITSAEISSRGEIFTQFSQENKEVEALLKEREKQEGLRAAAREDLQAAEASARSSLGDEEASVFERQLREPHDSELAFWHDFMSQTQEIAQQASESWQQIEAAKMQATSMEADRLAKEQSEKEEADRLAKEQAEKDEAARLAKEQAEKEEAARHAKEQAEKEEAERLAKEQAEKEEAERLAKEQAEKEEAARLAKEQAAKDEAARLAKEQAAKEEAERLAKEQAEKEEAARLAKEQAEKEEAARLAKEQAAKEEAERLAKEQAAKEEAARLAKEQAEKTDKQEKSVTVVAVEVPPLSTGKESEPSKPEGSPLLATSTVDSESSTAPPSTDPLDETRTFVDSKNQSLKGSAVENEFDELPSQEEKKEGEKKVTFGAEAVQSDQEQPAVLITVAEPTGTFSSQSQQSLSDNPDQSKELESLLTLSTRSEENINSSSYDKETDNQLGFMRSEADRMFMQSVSQGVGLSQLLFELQSQEKDERLFLQQREFESFTSFKMHKNMLLAVLTDKEDVFLQSNSVQETDAEFLASSSIKPGSINPDMERVVVERGMLKSMKGGRAQSEVASLRLFEAQRNMIESDESSNRQKVVVDEMMEFHQCHTSHLVELGEKRSKRINRKKSRREETLEIQQTLGIANTDIVKRVSAISTSASNTPQPTPRGERGEVRDPSRSWESSPSGTPRSHGHAMSFDSTDRHSLPSVKSGSLGERHNGKGSGRIVHVKPPSKSVTPGESSPLPLSQEAKKSMQTMEIHQGIQFTPVDSEFVAFSSGEDQSSPLFSIRAGSKSKDVLIQDRIEEMFEEAVFNLMLGYLHRWNSWAQRQGKLKKYARHCRQMLLRNYKLSRKNAFTQWYKLVMARRNKRLMKAHKHNEIVEHLENWVRKIRIKYAFKAWIKLLFLRMRAKRALAVCQYLGETHIIFTLTTYVRKWYQFTFGATTSESIENSGQLDRTSSLKKGSGRGDSHDNTPRANKRERKVSLAVYHEEIASLSRSESRRSSHPFGEGASTTSIPHSHSPESGRSYHQPPHHAYSKTISPNHQSAHADYMSRIAEHKRDSLLPMQRSASISSRGGRSPEAEENLEKIGAVSVQSYSGEDEDDDELMAENPVWAQAIQRQKRESQWSQQQREEDKRHSIVAGLSHGEQSQNQWANLGSMHHKGREQSASDREREAQIERRAERARQNLAKIQNARKKKAHHFSEGLQRAGKDVGMAEINNFFASDNVKPNDRIKKKKN